MATLRSAQVELGPAWQGPSSIGIASIGYSFGQQVAFFGAANGGGWVAIGSGITSNSSTNQVTGGTFTRVEYYRALKPIQSYDEVKKRTILSDIDYAQQDYCIGIELAEAMPLSTLRGTTITHRFQSYKTFFYSLSSIYISNNKLRREANQLHWLCN